MPNAHTHTNTHEFISKPHTTITPLNICIQKIKEKIKNRSKIKRNNYKIPYIISHCYNKNKNKTKY